MSLTDRNLDQEIDKLIEMIGDDPMALVIRDYVEIGRRLEADGAFEMADAAEIADLLLRHRSPAEALGFLDRLGQRGQQTMLHRAVIGEITRRAQSD